ncbi:MAG TPA: hypothetical protein VHV47_04855 [Opitutaceae bacterium]|jgi:hypothetical protein|nr:hypothetical protein [Opitutaceae bacterium]
MPFPELPPKLGPWIRSRARDLILVAVALWVTDHAFGAPFLSWPVQALVLTLALLVPQRSVPADAGAAQRAGARAEHILLVAAIAAALFRLWLGVPWLGLAFAPVWGGLAVLAAGAFRAKIQVYPMIRARRLDVPLGCVGLAAAALYLATCLAPGFWSWPLGRAQFVFLVWAILAFGLYFALLRAIRSRADSTDENLRWIGLAAAALFLLRGLTRFTLHGTEDALWYAMMLQDMIRQIHAGQFPVWLGQSEYQFNGAIYPLRIAPAFHYLGAALDALTLHGLGVFALQNFLLILLGLGGLASAYVTLASLLPNRKGLAAGLALLFLSCPGVLGMAYHTDLFMSWTVLPWVPWVWWAMVRSFSDGGRGRTLTVLGAALGLCWWGHSPIALWLTLVASAGQGLRVARDWKSLSWRGVVAGVLAFTAIAAYPVGSVVLFPPEAGVNGASFQAAAPATIAYFVQQAAPGIFLPLSPSGRALGDFQLGYSLWTLLLFTVFARPRQRPAASRFLSAASFVLLLMLIPVPGLNLALWRIVPATVRNITSNWAMNRLYVVLAGAVVYGLAAALAAGPGRRRGLAGLVALGCLWSGMEAAKFSEGSRRETRAAHTASDFVRPENVAITRYAYVAFPRLPAYFTNGVTDPGLENRLRADNGQLLADNFAAALALGTPAGQTSFEPASPVPGDYLKSTTPLLLRPGRSYLLKFNFLHPDATQGVLQLTGPGLGRVYALPEYGEPASFGIGGSHRDTLSVRTSDPQGESIQLAFRPTGPSNSDLGSFAEVSLIEYDPERLPVKVLSWIPYEAKVRSDQPAWLETPRMFQRGYIAEVNGAAAPIRKSPEGLVAARVPGGESRVTLRYRAPAGLQALFWASLTAVAGAFVGGAWSARRALIATR